ncbi:MAG: Gfo/Idh/MocA family oxidoreductase [Bryobacterales bacterium]|nr:Gfo/Idh/MocA family oxidoreductase [Bryobacterales bacterium]
MAQLSRRAVVAGGSGLMWAQAAAVKLPQKVKLAVIGVEGHLGEVKEALPALPDVEVVAAMHTTPEKARRQFPKAKIYGDYRKMLDENKADVVAVCNTNGERAEAVLECARRGVHIISEKPLGITFEEMGKVSQAVRASKGKITTLFPMRFSPEYLALRQVVQSGVIGEVVQVGTQKSYKAPAPGDWRLNQDLYGGTIPWIGIHMVDLMRFVTGRDFTEAYSMQSALDFGRTATMESVTASVFKMDNRGLAVLRMDYFRPKAAPTHGDDRMRVAGSKGVLEYMAATGITLVTEDKAPEVIRDLPAPRHLFVEFLEHIYNGKPEPITWRDIERANYICLHAKRSGETGRPERCAG